MSYAPRLRKSIGPTSRGPNPLFVRQCRCGARPSSTVLSTPHRSLLLQVPLASRNFSLWPSSKTNTTSISSPPSPAPVNSAEEAEVLPGTSPVGTSNATTSVDSSIAEPPVTPESTILDSTTITDVLHNLPDPLQFGDFTALGLTSWWPPGIICWSFEILNVTSGLPWFWTIVAGSAFWRLVCVPLTIKATKTASILQPHQEELAALQARVQQTASARNPAAMAKANREMRELYQKLGVSPFGGLVGFLQLPITLGMFFGVKRMCDLPVEQMKYSGFEMFPDLTATDPTMILPIAMTVAVNAQLLFGARDIAGRLRPMMYLFHLLTIPGFFIMKGLPVGLILSILTTGTLTMSQTLFMRVPQVRRALGMPAYIPPQDGGKSALAELRTFLSKDGDVKRKVAEARRDAMKKKTLEETFKRR